MKKLIIAAAFVCAAAVTQAATVSWTLSSLQDSKGAALDGGHVYTFTTKGDNATTIAAVTEALSGMSSSAAFIAALGDLPSLDALSGTMSTAGSFSVSKTDQAASGIKGSQAGTQLFALVTDTDTITDTTKWYVTALSGAKKTAADSTGTDTSFSITDTGSHTASNWNNVVAAPEPTSAMLLLLGFAGLALKRKNA